ncbi:MAG TPA: GxxExxY protein [Flavobacteriales bacterium]|nr:GxxExxY protein [Flavobacteriales bacterium]
MEINRITGIIIEESIEIHRELGPGLLESVYEAVLARRLGKRGLQVRRQVPVPLIYDGETFEEAFRIDLLVDERIVVELKSVELMPLVAFKKTKTYLSLMNLEVGLLINFGEQVLKDGLHRIVNKYKGPRPNDIK